MQLATRFAPNSRVIQSLTAPLSDDQLRAAVPSIFAEAPHDSRSQRYTYIPTIKVVTALRKEGFEPFFATQAKARDESRHDFTKHMLRLRHATIARGAEVPEIILVNSHDGTTSYQMIAGMFRFVCKNGMVVGNTVDEIRVQHKGDIVHNVIEGAYTVLDEFAQVHASAESMKAVTLSDSEQSAFARAALVAKYGEPEDTRGTRGGFPVLERDVLEARRHDDQGADLWRTFSRAQENLVRGGMHGRAASGRRNTTREVRGISENVQLNRALWTLAEKMREIKAGSMV